jgi:hypothetical protein
MKKRISRRGLKTSASVPKAAQAAWQKVFFYEP